MEININGTIHKIQTVTYAKQCDAYYEAKERGDVYAMHMLFLPPVYKPLWVIKSEIKMLELKAQLDYELKRTKNMPKELLELEMRLKYEKTRR